MPIYLYRCADCGHSLEALQKMSDAKLTDCPECQAPALQKQITAAAFKLKGTGWYETDFKNSGKPAAAKAAGSEASSDTKSSSSAGPASAGAE
ncbi:FmdB family zinc ribbon protein [Arenicella xantha]|uniref:Putative FmdB family regulatory protein n=1 Tax=Arenicella xantha TaxID=644221 RepID=A0A395JNM0_9GAMM|nr:FmdB family zinc ribbon protein [Arenicella xantha]RBP53244.1 putative FmdB family regulatory protein [Arenicella xantha]